jgi:hypothetical protein
LFQNSGDAADISTWTSFRKYNSSLGVQNYGKYTIFSFFSFVVFIFRLFLLLFFCIAVDKIKQTNKHQTITSKKTKKKKNTYTANQQANTNDEDDEEEENSYFKGFDANVLDIIKYLVKIGAKGKK